MTELFFIENVIQINDVRTVIRRESPSDRFMFHFNVKQTA